MDENQNVNPMIEDPNRVEPTSAEKPADTAEVISAETVSTTGTLVSCINCGTPLAEDQAFCPKCGTPKKKKPVCGKCGAELAEGQAFCPKCGQKVGVVIDERVTSQINQFNAGVKKKKSKKKFIPIIIAAVVVVAIVVAALLLKGPSVDEIRLGENSIELRVDDSQTISYTISPDKASDVEVTWESSDESVATVSKSGRVTGEDDGTCTITATAGGKSDSLTVTVKSGPDFESLYDEYCQSTWAELGADRSYLSLDTNPYDEDDDALAYIDAYYAMAEINEVLGLPDSLFEEFGETTALDGRQEEDFPEQGVTVSWRYHPDQGLEVTYKEY